MARTTEQIEQEILQAKSSYAELNALNSPSNTAIWRLWVKLTAFMHHVLEKLFDVFRQEILAIIDQNRTGTLLWYAEKVRAFQFGDLLNIYGEYDTIDASKRIITRVSVKEISSGTSIEFRGLLLKVAKGEPPVQLNTTELQALTQYIKQIKFAGVSTTIVNLPAEPVFVNIQVFYKDVTEAIALQNIKEAIGGYIANIPFDGVFAINDLIAACRSKAGIVDVLVNSVTINASLVTGGRYEALSGYYSFDANSSSNNYIMTAL